MAKRLPPSKRAERQMDDTARSIAEARAAAKPEKLTPDEKAERNKSFSPAPQTGKGLGSAKPVNAGKAAPRRTKAGES